MRTKKQLLNSIKSLGTRATKLQEDIHTIAMECLEHAQEHGDVVCFQTLYNSLPNGQRRETLLVWAASYTPIRVTQKGAKAGLDKKAKELDNPWKLEEANANPYWTLDERSVFKYKVKDLDDIIAQAIKSELNRIGKAVEHHENKDDPYELDFDPQQREQAVLAKAKALGYEMEPVLN